MRGREKNTSMIIFKKHYLNKNGMFQLLFGISILFLTVSSGNAQVTDTASNSKSNQHPASDPAVKPKYHSPKKASLMSTVVPGLGQVYNKKYWKVPIIYGGLAGLAYSFNFNQTQYVIFRDAYRDRLLGVPDAYPRYTPDNLNTLQAYYLRFRNLSAIGISLLYLMNIIDASVDAHMFAFDVSDNLSLNIRPALINTAFSNHYSSGLSLNITF